MTTLRCTAKLLRRLGVEPDEDAPAPTGRLGDWYAHVLTVERAPVVLCVNERTLISVLLTLKERSTLLDRFRSAAGELLGQLAGDPRILSEEISALADIRVGRTRSRSVLATMNQFIFELRYFNHPRGPTIADLPAIAAGLRDTPCGGIGHRFPEDLARELLGGTARDWPKRGS